MARVQLTNITKIYPGGVKAVDDVSLTIGDHEFVVLVGPSGCGKSTTLRLIAGLEDSDGGTVHIGDRDVTDVPPKDRDIAMVFQNYALYPHMSVYGNLSFGLRLRRMPGPFWTLRNLKSARAVKKEIRDRVLRVADMLDIRPLLDRKPRELSGGQRQRVAVGRAIVRDPAAFLFDEPLSNLDARLRLSTRAELKRLHQQLRTTTVYVTHDQEEAMTLGERIVVMKDGRIHQDGPPLALYHQPVNRFVAGFIGMPPMNFFDGRLGLAADGQGWQFVERVGQDLKTSAETGNGLTLQPQGFTLVLSGTGPLRRNLPRLDAGEVVLGIRPEHLSLRPIRADDGTIVSTPLTVRVSLIEPLGSSIDLYLQSAGHEQIVARVEAPAGMVMAGSGSVEPVPPTGSSGSLPQVGSLVEVHVDLRRVHLFEPGDTGMNLSLETTRSGQPTTELAHAMA